MWTNLFVLSCLYPIFFLAFVIGYTYHYSSQKDDTAQQVQIKSIELETIRFAQPEPTTVVITAEAVITPKPASPSAVPTVSEEKRGTKCYSSTNSSDTSSNACSRSTKCDSC
jgi:hypothetical protein